MATKAKKKKEKTGLWFLSSVILSNLSVLIICGSNLRMRLGKISINQYIIYTACNYIYYVQIEKKSKNYNFGTATTAATCAFLEKTDVCINYFFKKTLIELEFTA